MNQRIELILRAIFLITPLIFLSSISFHVPFLHQIFLHQIFWLLNLFEIQFQAHGYYIMTSNFSSTIVFDCIGWKQFYIFCAMIFLPIGIDLSYRLKGLLILIPLYIYNLFRVVATISLMEFLSYSYFELIHYLLWDFLFLVLIFLPWYWWHLSYNGNIKTGKKILKKKIKPQTGKKNVKKKNVKRKVKLQNRKKVLNKKNTKKKIGLKTGKKVVKKNSK